MEIELIEAHIAELGRSLGPMDQYSADRLRALAHADDLELFWIVNTAGKKAYFLARSPRLARHTAIASNHIQHIDNGDCFRATEAFYAKNPGFGSSVRRAIQNRMPGPILQKSNHAVMGDLVFSPLSEVKK